MANLALHPDALTTKCLTLKHWLACSADRPEKLRGWQTTRGEDGRLYLSAELRGPNPADALRAFMGRQALFLSLRVEPSVESSADDVMPYLDFSTPGRTAAVWRLSGVWVEVWYPDVPDAAPRPVQRPPQAATVQARRGLGGRLPYTRRNKTTKETNPA